MTLQQLADFSYVTFNCLNSLVLRTRAVPCQAEGSLLFHPSQPCPTGRMACRGTAVGKITFWTLQAAQENVGNPRSAVWNRTVDYLAVNFACAKHSSGCHEPAEPLQPLEDMLVAQLQRLSPWPCSLWAIRCINPMGHPPGAQAGWHHGLVPAETCHTTAPEWTGGVISWHPHPGHWLHCWTAWNIEYTLELLMQIIPEGIWVGMIMESIWLSCVMQLFELSSLFLVRYLRLMASLGWCWVFSEKIVRVM